MDRTNFNFVIDALMFLCLMAMAGLGFLMKYALVPGREAWAKYGRSVTLTWLGWDRHDWGQIHLYLAFILLGLLVIHLYLHWQMILGLYARLIPDPETRKRLTYALLIITAICLFLPFLISPNVQERGRGGGRGGGLYSRLNTGTAAVSRNAFSATANFMPAGETGGQYLPKG